MRLIIVLLRVYFVCVYTCVCARMLRKEYLRRLMYRFVEIASRINHEFYFISDVIANLILD